MIFFDLDSVVSQCQESSSSPETPALLHANSGLQNQVEQNVNFRKASPGLSGYFWNSNGG